MLRITGFLAFGICVAALLPIPARAQAAGEHRYGAGFVKTTDKTSIKAQSLAFDGDSLRFVDARTLQPGVLSLRSVQRVVVQGGHPVVEAAVLMGGAMLVGSLLGVKQADSSTGSGVSSGTKTAIVGGMTAGGVLIGALVGSATHKYKTVFKNGQLVASLPTAFAAGGSAHRVVRLGVAVPL